MILSYAAFWFVLAAVAIANGALREATYGRHLSELRAHQLSTLGGIAAITLAAGPFLLWFPPTDAGQARVVGALWCGMTLAFEFGFGRLVARHSWARLCADYNVLAGRLWLPFLIWIAILPSILFAALHGAP